MRTHGPLRLETFVDAMFQENAYLLDCPPAPSAWCIDPSFPPQPAQLLAAAQRRTLHIETIVLTHCHPDHIAGVGAIRRQFPNATILAPRREADWLTDATLNLSAGMGFPITAPPADRLLDPGDELNLGELTWRVLDVSGHSPGGLAFYCERAGVVIVGDALFAGSIGRYDFPGSDGARLLENIARHLLTLPDETVVYSGHGPATTIGRERRTNPMLTGALSL